MSSFLKSRLHFARSNSPAATNLSRGNTARNLSRVLSQMKSKREFHCGTDISELIKDKDLKTKEVTADKRLTCNHRVDWKYYHTHDTAGNVKKFIGICAFCGCELKNPK